MRRFAISEFSTYRWSLEQEATEYQQRGIQAIGLWRTKLSDSEIELASDLLYQHDMRVSSLSWAGGFTGTCGISHEDAIDDAKAAIRTAARLGGHCLIVHSGGRGGHTRGHANRLLTSALNRLVPIAADYGVRLALELMQASECANWTVAESFKETIDVVSRYSPRHVGLVLDLFHVGRDATVYESLDELVKRIALVQLADRKNHDLPHRCLLGHGDISVAEWYDRLEKFGYDGFYEVELHGPELAELSYRHRMDHSLAFWKRMRQNIYTTH